MKIKVISIVLAIFLLSFATSFGQEVSLDNSTNIGVMWHGEPDSIMAGSTYVFDIRMNNNTLLNPRGVTNGFRVYSPNGATWSTTVADTVGLGKTEFEAGFFINNFSVTGSASDTVGIGGFTLFGAGLAAGYNNISYTITIGPIPGGATHHGQTICLDSSFYPSGTWKWAPTGVNQFPSWTGPHCYTVVDEATDISLGADGLPQSFDLAQNYPNPFNPSTTIEYALPTASDVNLTIYNITGQKVKEFSRENQPAGSGPGYSFEWDASNVSSGVYFYKIVAGNFTDTKKMMLLK